MFMRLYLCVWFGLVSLLNGISTFVGYLMTKSSMLKDSCGAIKTIDRRIRGFIAFSLVFV